MSEYLWAAITIISLTAAWYIIRRKRDITGEIAMHFGRTVSTLMLLAVWSGWNFVKSASLIAPGKYTMAQIFFDALAVASLVGAGIIGLLILPFAMPEMIKHARQNSRQARFANMIEEINSHLWPGNIVDFISGLAKTMAGYFQPAHFEISAINSEREWDRLETYTFNPASFDLKFSYKQIPDENNDQILSEIILCDEDFSLNLEVGPDDYEIYRIKYCLRKTALSVMSRAYLKILESTINTRLRELNELAVKEENLDVVDRSNRLYSIAGRSRDLTDYLRHAFPIVTDKIKSDYISVAVIDAPVQNMHRFTYAEVGGRLIERGICYPLKQTITLKAAREKELLIANTLESDFYRDDYHLYRSGFSSRLAWPLKDNTGGVRGVLTLAAVKPRAFDRVDEFDLAFLSEPFSRMIELHMDMAMLTSLKKQIVSGFALTFGLENNAQLTDFYNRSARILSETLPATMCRVWSYDRQNNRLESIGYHSLHPDGTPENEEKNRIELGLMPRHKSAIDMGKAVIVNQTNTEFQMDRPEMEALGLPGMKSAILAPMRLQNRVTGIISVGEVRNWERRSLGQQELLYSQIITTIAALVRDLELKADSLGSMRTRLESLDGKSQLYDVYAGLPSKISSSLSAILGAAQLVKQNLPESNQELGRYNDMILKGANSIMQEIRHFDEIKSSVM